MTEPTTESPPPPPAPPPHRGPPVLAIILLVLGIPILALSGTCTTVFSVSFLAGGQDQFINSLALPLLFGGPFVALGALLTWAGWRSLRRHRRRRGDQGH